MATMFGSTCAVCGEAVDQILDRCITCGADVGAPNVRGAVAAEEQARLGVRYESAVHEAIARGAKDTLEGFQKALISSVAVINCSLPFLKEFITQPKTLFANYHRTVQAEVRRAAAPENDRERTVVDAILFGSYGTSIRFAALSLNSRGVVSYGPYSMVLREIAISRRASVLEENSYNFVKHHNLGAMTPIPIGYRSDWSGRTKLAIAKLGSRLDVGPQHGGFADLLLHSEGNRETDEFMEVHIFGTFDFSSVESIAGPIPRKPIDAAVWEVVKETANKAGKRVEEH